MTESKEQTYERLAILLVRAVMRSASPQVIPPIQWWSRAKTALATGASQCRIRGRYSVLISKMADALQIENMKMKSAHVVAEIERELESLDVYDFADVCERDAVFIVAKAQIERTEERDQWNREENELTEAAANLAAAIEQQIVDGSAQAIIDIDKLAKDTI